MSLSTLIPNFPIGSGYTMSSGDNRLPLLLIMGIIVYEWVVECIDWTTFLICFSPENASVRPECIYLLKAD